jgi:hypothetical protein
VSRSRSTRSGLARRSRPNEPSAVARYAGGDHGVRGK